MAALPIALQLYTVRDETARDFAGTLERVAALGYAAVEFAGYGDLSAEAMRSLLERTGLQAASTHVGLAALDADLAREIDYCLAIGSRNLVLPWLPPDQRSPAFLAALAPRLNEFGRQCKEQGIAFAYHNHDFEFVQNGGTYLLDSLLDSTDPALVQLEFDVYWAAYAGVDPGAYLQRRAGRVPLLHVKDMAPDRTFTEVGDGTLDIRGLVAGAGQLGVQWLIIEHDRPSMPSLESAARSLGNLRQIVSSGAA
jgi:sugar phosphate isomerase/epimerase